MHILAISIKYPTSLQKWFVNYLHSLEMQGAKIDVVSLSEPPSYHYPKIDQIETRSSWIVEIGPVRGVFRFFSSLISTLLSRKSYRFIAHCFINRRNFKDFIYTLLLLPACHYTPDVIHCHSEKAAFKLLTFLKFFKSPILITFHGLPPEGIDDLSAEQRFELYKSVFCVIGNTEFSIQQLRSLTEFSCMTAVIPQGIDVDEFSYNPTGDDTGGKLVLLTVGRLDRLKGHEYVFHAIDDLVRRGYPIEYWVAGEGLYKQRLEEIAKDLRIEDRVFFLGTVMGEELTSLYRKSTFLVVPSLMEKTGWAETQGIVIQEAQASGLLVIAASTGGIPECVADGATGFLVEQKCAEDISRMVVYLCNQRKNWKSWKDKARRDVESRFSLTAMGDDLMKTYKKVVSVRID